MLRTNADHASQGVKLAIITSPVIFASQTSILSQTPGNVSLLAVQVGTSQNLGNMNASDAFPSVSPAAPTPLATPALSGTSRSEEVSARPSAGTAREMIMKNAMTMLLKVL